VHRAWHALPSLSTQKGEAVQAVYGFLSILLRAIKEFEPTHIAAAFDMEGPTFRHKKFKEYKATRQKAPDELYAQIPLVKEALEAMHVPVYEKRGFEADDIVGTIADKASKDGALETVILSGDMDTLQLVDKKTKVYTMRKGVQDSVLFDEKAVEAKFEGLKPDQLIDYKGLRGDPSDNIPGVSGIGEKTAIHLLQEFCSIENLYEALEKEEGISDIKPGVQEKLRQGKKSAFMSKDLAIIERDAPIQFGVEDARWKQPTSKESRDLLARFEFESLAKRMPGGQQHMFGRKEPAAVKEDSIQEKIERLYKDEVFSKQVYELEKKLVPILRTMECIGIQIDLPYFTKLTGEMEQEVAKLSSQIYEYSKNEFNINSTQQLSKVLFEPPPEGLELSPRGLKKTPKGIISTASPELEKLEGTHPIIGGVLRHREIQKLLTTYARPLPKLADEHGRVHTHFDQLGAATGRLSSSEPNLQNIPNQGDWGKKIRRGFVAEEGFELVSFDYSQMELRIAAHISGDPQMREFFAQGADIHRMTAAAVFGVPGEEVSDEMRFRAKALNFGVLYGMGAGGFAKSAGITQEEARDFIEQYFVRFPKIYEYMEETKAIAREQGYVETLLGRRRYIPEIHSSTPQLRAAAERMAINHPIQGTLADITKMAMVKVAEELKPEAGKVRMLLQIHDELLFEIRSGMIHQIGQQIQQLMEEILTFEVPVVVDVKQGVSWGEMKKLTS
jgi:DNA polymerase I-like protein with 3'-5' exonuclease and polymerase domains